MNICLIVINYNGLKFLNRYLINLNKSCLENNIDLYVSDDRSNDGSVEFLKKNNFKYFVNNRQNNGFASNVNNGLISAKQFKNYDYYLISNNDIEINQFFFSNLKLLFSRLLFLGNVGIVGFNEINDLNKEDSTGCLSVNELSINEVKTVPGFFFLLTNNCVEKVGFFDEDYFMYGEDNDYFCRVLNSGYKIFCSNIPVFHHSEGSSVNHKKTSWFVYRNSLLFIQKNGNFYQFIKMILKLAFYIFIPFTRNVSPSVLRIRRSGFFYNIFLLSKSVIWNVKYFIKNKT